MTNFIKDVDPDLPFKTPSRIDYNYWKKNELNWTGEEMYNHWPHYIFVSTRLLSFVIVCAVWFGSSFKKYCRHSCDVSMMEAFVIKAGVQLLQIQVLTICLR